MFSSASFLGKPDTEENRAAFVATVPLGRGSTPNDVANACCYLASDEANFITGVNLEVSLNLICDFIYDFVDMNLAGGRRQMHITWRSLLRCHGQESIPDLSEGPMGIVMRQFRPECGYLSFDSHCCLKHSSNIDELVW